MTSRILYLTAAALAPVAMYAWLSTDIDAQQAGAARVPQFQVDPSWPMVPNNWVLGEATSISVDKQDHIWVLHVPQSIPEAQRANAAPPVLEFDQSGKLLRSWGAPADGSPWPGREHGIFVDDDNFVWIGGRAGWPKPTAAGVSDDMIVKYTTAGKFVMQIGKSGQSKGNLDTENVHQATDVFVDTRAKEVYAADGYGNKRVIVFDSETGKFKRMWGAFGNPPPATLCGQCRRAAAADDPGWPAGVRPAACDQGLARWRRLRRGPDQQPHPAVHARGQVHQAGPGDERRQHGRPRAGRLLVLARRQAAVSSTSSTPA